MNYNPFENQVSPKHLGLTLKEGAITESTYDKAESGFNEPTLLRIEHETVQITVTSFEGFTEIMDEMFAKVREAIENGYLDALPQFEFIKDFDVSYNIFLEYIKEKALAEAQRFHKEELKQMNWEISTTGDTLDLEHDKVIKHLTDALKYRKELHKIAHKTGKPCIDEETGEEIGVPTIKTPAKLFLRRIKHND